MKRSATAKPTEAGGERRDPPPAHLRPGRGQRHGEDREAGEAVAAQAQLHVEQALAAGLVADRRQRLHRRGEAGRDGVAGAAVAELRVLGRRCHARSIGRGRGET